MGTIINDFKRFDDVVLSLIPAIITVDCFGLEKSTLTTACKPTYLRNKKPKSYHKDRYSRFTYVGMGSEAIDHVFNLMLLP